MGKHDLKISPDSMIVSIPENLEPFREKLDTIQHLLLNIDNKNRKKTIKEIENATEKHL